uniref:Uncharacterized protein n=1 Tax=Sinocyclocheilus grahami TaxID=75366 RepID=A0A672PUV0_SINGR
MLELTVKWQIMGACLAEASVTLTAQHFGTSSMTLSVKNISVRKPKVNDMDSHTLSTVSRQHRSTAKKKKDHRELYKANIHERTPNSGKWSPGGSAMVTSGGEREKHRARTLTFLFPVHLSRI